ncbi:MAG: TolC family protein, partial [Phenylobacterium sp.]|nr:TolC family protein [Phenylobacterium sp.]
MSFVATDATGRARPPGPNARAITVIGLVALTLSACASAPRSADTRLPVAYEAPAGAALPDQALDRWWTVFDDPALIQLVDSALEQSHDARIAAARLDEARAVRRGQVRQL